MNFTEQEKQLLRELNINQIESDEDFIKAEDKVSEHLQIYGFDENYEPTEIGLVCESIIDKLTM